MSRIFGEIRQNGYIVHDLEPAMRHWAEDLGIGPWYSIGVLAANGLRYRGQLTTARVAIALANSGELQLELIQPLDDEPSPYRDFLAANGEGLQHLSTWPSAARYDAAVAAHKAAGGEVLFEGQAGRSRFIYLETGGHDGTVMEMADLSPGSQRLFAAIREQARNWDGSDPIRRGWPEV
jgi:hypothetical protein